MPVADALAAILSGAEPLPEEMIALDAAYHRVLARDAAALRTQPPQAMSAMDGYAVRAVDASQVAARLQVIGEAAAGRALSTGRAGGGNQGSRGRRRRQHRFHWGCDRGPPHPSRRRRFSRGRRAAARGPP